ncbi:MAG: DUF2625 family protein, partial [Myxococcota bacterium]
MKTLDELIDHAEPGLPVVCEWVAQARNDAVILPCDPAAGDRTLLDLQVTTRSPMGAIAHATGGLLVDAGWVRVLGAGCDRLPRSITGWNGMGGGAAAKLPHVLLVGDDAIGGFFAISGGGIDVPRGRVGYVSPDALFWEDTELGYSDWLGWLFQGDLATYYENVRWPAWRDDVRGLPGDQGVHIYPPFHQRPLRRRTESKGGAVNRALEPAWRRYFGGMIRSRCAVGCAHPRQRGRPCRPREPSQRNTTKARWIGLCSFDHMLRTRFVLCVLLFGCDGEVSNAFDQQDATLDAGPTMPDSMPRDRDASGSPDAVADRRVPDAEFFGPHQLDDLPAGQWMVISNNTLRDVMACPDGGCPYRGNTGIKSVMRAWCGGAFATQLGAFGSLIAFGGGHADYYGNEVYAFDIATGLWSRVSEPYDGGTEACIEATGSYPDGTPCPPHTYDGVEYDPGTNAFVLLGSEANNRGGYYSGYPYRRSRPCGQPQERVSWFFFCASMCAPLSLR